jgi:hypothetical protein
MSRWTSERRPPAGVLVEVADVHVPLAEARDGASEGGTRPESALPLSPRYRSAARSPKMESLK